MSMCLSVSLSVYMFLYVCMFVCLSVGLLPLRGIIPDMTADSEKYIQLHSLYREQAAVDVVAVTTHLLRLLQTIGRVC